MGFGFLDRARTSENNKKVILSMTLINVIFVVVFLFLLSFSILSYLQVRFLIKENNLVIHTNHVIHEINSVLLNLLNVESNQRGYLVSEQQQFLDDVEASKMSLKKNLGELKQLTEDNSEQNARVFLFSNLIDKRLELINQLIHLKIRGDLTTNQAMEIFNQSNDISSRVKGLGREIQSVEFTLLQTRNKEAIESAYITNYVLIFGNIISFVFLICAAIFANLEINMRRKIEQNSYNIYMQLRKIIESSSDMIAAFDDNERLIIFNDSYQREFKLVFDCNVSIGMTLDEALTGVSENKQEVANIWRESLYVNDYKKIIEASIKNGTTRYYELTSSAIQNSEHENQGYVQNISNITQNIEEKKQLQDSYDHLAISNMALEEKNKQITLLVEMSDIMLACSSVNELCEAINNFAGKLLSFARGYLFIMHPSKNYLEKISCWGEPHSQDEVFNPQHCWGIRLGRMHQVDEMHDSLICSHIPTDNVCHLCVPLMAQNDIYGLLYLETDKDNPPLDDENQRLLTTAFSELTALALANVQLRENLRYQSIRDALTGLYNRNYLEEFLQNKIHQAMREDTTIAVLMMDLDHFKSINDTYGHEAGDVALKQVGEVLKSSVRAGDVAARYGGEEFVLLLLNNISQEDAKKRAETILKKIANLTINYGAERIGQITISIGIAMYPKDGRKFDELIANADKALYSAKNKGRNCVVLFAQE